MQNNRLILAIIAGVFVWGLWLAAGAYWNYEPNTNPWRFVVVLGCVTGFLAFWLLMLLARKPR
jgi:hypothetical protein